MWKGSNSEQTQKFTGLCINDDNGNVHQDINRHIHYIQAQNNNGTPTTGSLVQYDDMASRDGRQIASSLHYQPPAAHHCQPPPSQSSSSSSVSMNSAVSDNDDFHSSDFYCDDDDLVHQLKLSTDDRRLQQAFQSLQALRTANTAYFQPVPEGAAVLQESESCFVDSEMSASEEKMVCSDPCIYRNGGSVSDDCMGQYHSTTDNLYKSSSSDPYVEPTLMSPLFSPLPDRQRATFFVEPSGSGWDSAESSVGLSCSRTQELGGNWQRSKANYRLTFSQSPMMCSTEEETEKQELLRNQKVPHNVMMSALMAQKRRDDNLKPSSDTGITLTSFGKCRSSNNHTVTSNNSNCDMDNLAKTFRSQLKHETDLVEEQKEFSKTDVRPKLTSWHNVHLERRQLTLTVGSELRKSASQPESFSHCLSDVEINLGNNTSTQPNSQAVSLLSLYRRSKSLSRNCSMEDGTPSESRVILCDITTGQQVEVSNALKPDMVGDDDHEASYVNLKDRYLGDIQCERCMRLRGNSISVQTSVCLQQEDKALQTSFVKDQLNLWMHRGRQPHAYNNIQQRMSVTYSSTPVLTRSLFYTMQTLPDLSFLRTTSATALNKDENKSVDKLSQMYANMKQTSQSSVQSAQHPSRSRSLESGFSDYSGGSSTPPLNLNGVDGKLVAKRSEHRGSYGDIGYASQSTGSDADSSASSGGKVQEVTEKYSSMALAEKPVRVVCDIDDEDGVNDESRQKSLRDQSFENTESKSMNQSDSCHSLPAQSMDGDEQDTCQPLKPCLVRRRKKATTVAGEQGVRLLKHRSWSDPYDVQQLHHQCYLGCMKLLTDLSAISAKLAALQEESYEPAVCKSLLPSLESNKLVTPPNSPDCVGDQITNPCLGYCEYRTGAPIDVVSRAKKSVSFSENICYHSPYSSPHHSPQKMPLSMKPTDNKTACSRPTGLCVPVTTVMPSKPVTIDLSDDYELPPQDFVLSPVLPEESNQHADIERCRELVYQVKEAVLVILKLYSNQLSLEMQGDENPMPGISHLVLECLCPALSNLLHDGLNMHSVTFFGKVMNNGWRIAEESARLECCPRSVFCIWEDIVALKSLLQHPYLKFDAFIFGLLNGHLLDVWLIHVGSQTQMLSKFYQPTAFFILAHSSPLVCDQFAELVLAVRQLSKVTFNIEYVFELRHLQEKAAAKKDRKMSSRSSSESEISVCSNGAGNKIQTSQLKNVDMFLNQQKREISALLLSNSEDEKKEKAETDVSNCANTFKKNVDINNFLVTPLNGEKFHEVSNKSKRTKTERPVSEHFDKPRDVWNETGKLIYRQSSGFLRAVRQYAVSEINRFSSSSASSSSSLSASSSSVRSSVDSAHGSKLSSLPFFGAKTLFSKAEEADKGDISFEQKEPGINLNKKSDNEGGAIEPKIVHCDQRVSEIVDSKYNNVAQNNFNMDTCFSVCNDNYRETSVEKTITSDDIFMCSDADRFEKSKSTEQSPDLTPCDKKESNSTSLQTLLTLTADAGSRQNNIKTRDTTLKHSLSPPSLSAQFLPSKLSATSDTCLFEKDPAVPPAGVFSRVLNRLRSVTVANLQNIPEQAVYKPGVTEYRFDKAKNGEGKHQSVPPSMSF